jgi:hypothetical protein
MWPTAICIDSAPDDEVLCAFELPEAVPLPFVPNGVMVPLCVPVALGVGAVDTPALQSARTACICFPITELFVVQQSIHYCQLTFRKDETAPGKVFCAEAQTQV